MCRQCAATAETADPTRHAPPLFPIDPPTASFRQASEPQPQPPPPTATPLAGGAARPFPHAPSGYTLVERLGGGGMGEVYLARENTSERLVAMKFLKHPGDPAAFERFALELRVLGALDHPNIVRMFAPDFMRADPYFTMEYLSGGSLSRAVADAGPMAVGRAVGLVRVVIGAVAAAHAAKVIHRDLKPSNILLGPDGVPKVADFGLAKRLDEADPLTVASGALGTPGYMPPEQISRKNGEIGAWSDVYGLGATLYHLLTGRAPFVGDSVVDTIAKVLSDPPQRVRALRPEVPAALEGIVLKCLEKDPKARYQTVADLAADLNKFESGRAPGAPQLTRWRRVMRWAKQNRRGALVGVALTAMLVAVWLVNVKLAHWSKAGNRIQPTNGRWQAVAANPVGSPFEPELKPEQVRTNLRQGNQVVLISDTTARVPLGRGVGPCDVARALAVGEGVTIKSRGYTIVHLLDDPGVDRYRIRGEFRQDMRAPIGEPAKDSRTAQIGLALGHAKLGQDDTFVHFLATVTIGSGAAEADRAIELHSLVAVERPLAPLIPFRQRAAWVPHAPGDQAGWLALEVDIAPDAIVVRYNGRSASCGVGELNAGFERRAAEAGRLGAPLGDIPTPRWNTRRPLGVWVSDSWASVRNLSIEPLP